MKKLIPFHFMPGSWGLKGKVYREAEANYYYTGEELDRKLAEIHHEDDPIALREANHKIDFKWGKLSNYEYQKTSIDIELENNPTSLDAKRALIDLDLKNNKIDEYTAHRQLIELEFTDTEQELKLLELDYFHHKIEKNEFEKKSATLTKTPWVGVKDSWSKPDEGINGFYMELDWNEFWITYLRMHGYSGLTEEEIVSKWFTDVMSNDDSNDFLPTDSNSNSMGRAARTTNLRRDKDKSFYS